ncbi:DUF1127 domain-containing protein [Sneathiella litorea]|uniref:DUF1127 domain-containing protein n=1 Tax=Sneathiella litorea TaxID=2606216 RepID=A0A6L8W9Q6_9PROT|nr:DUF1127 domain-containing protein [Sneathiella litorea]MZR31264.1 DUF1127 domain-containing protein [Sneathiella litorea]
MISYGKKEVEALALIEPVNTNITEIDTEYYLNKARELRSKYFAEKVSALFQVTVGKYLRNREIEEAKGALYRMSDRELRDIGITRAEIDRAVEGTPELEPVKKNGFWTSFITKFLEAQTARAAYVHLMAMNSRELADIGLTRSEIEAAIKGDRKYRANDNLAQPSNTNDQRKAG